MSNGPALGSPWIGLVLVAIYGSCFAVAFGIARKIRARSAHTIIKKLRTGHAAVTVKIPTLGSGWDPRQHPQPLHGFLGPGTVHYSLDANGDVYAEYRPRRGEPRTSTGPLPLLFKKRRVHRPHPVTKRALYRSVIYGVAGFIVGFLVEGGPAADRVWAGGVGLLGFLLFWRLGHWVLESADREPPYGGYLRPGSRASATQRRIWELRRAQARAQIRRGASLEQPPERRHPPE